MTGHATRWYNADLGTERLCVGCRKGRLPTRERLRQILDGALHSLNAAKLNDTLKGNVRDETVVELAAMAHSLLYALASLDRCEPCIRIEVNKASELIVGRTQK